MTTIPKGFRIVPEEPTDEMMAAAIRLGTLEKWRDNFRTGDQYRIAMYKAMLAAAPTRAHSKSEYKRLNVLGANVAPPAGRDENTAGWISVKERLPEIGRRVLVAWTNSDGERKVGERVRLIPYDGAREFFWTYWHSRDGMLLPEAVTEWQPLPPPPTGAE